MFGVGVAQHLPFFGAHHHHGSPSAVKHQGANTAQFLHEYGQQKHEKPPAQVMAGGFIYSDVARLYNCS